MALHVQHSEAITEDSSLLVRINKEKLVPMTGSFMAIMDKSCPVLMWGRETIHCRHKLGSAANGTVSLSKKWHMISAQLSLHVELNFCLVGVTI